MLKYYFEIQSNYISHYIEYDVIFKKGGSIKRPLECVRSADGTVVVTLVKITSSGGPVVGGFEEQRDDHFLNPTRFLTSDKRSEV